MATGKSAIMILRTRWLGSGLVIMLATMLLAVQAEPDDEEERSPLQAPSSATQAPVLHLAEGPSGAVGKPAAAPPPAPAKQADTDDVTRRPEEQLETPLSLSATQQTAVGIRAEHPLALTSAPTIEGYATVLDPASLVGDLGRMQSSQAAASAAGADVARAERLYRDETQVSLKSLQASQAQAAETSAQARAASINFSQQWGPIASLTPAQRQALLAQITGGRAQLLRADVPGRHLGVVIGPQALIQADGAVVTAQVLGPLPHTDTQSQSAGWLLRVERAPAGFGPGARFLVQLHTAAVHGLLVPVNSLIYAHDGTYVFRQQDAGAESFRYAATPVQPLARVGNGWLVEGLKPTDAVVVRGAGVLWSLQGRGTFSAAEADHD